MRYSLLLLSALVCSTLGWEPGTQYVYKYVGRSAAGIYGLKQQNAVIELHCRTFIQSIDEQTLVVKLSEGRIKRNGNYIDNPYFAGEYSLTGSVVNPGHPEEIEGVEDSIPNPEMLGAPFTIIHNKGSIVELKVNEEEPEWIVNFKKSIAGQLQMDITAVRRDGPPVEWESVSDEVQGATFNVFESSVVGDCSTAMRVSRLPMSQVYAMEAYKLGSWESTCHGKPVWEIVKTKDFNRCQSNPVWYFANPTMHHCTFGTTNCGDFMQRTSVFKYVACGESVEKMTVIHAGGFSDLLATPFATKTEPLANSVIIDWALEKMEEFSYPFTFPSSFKTYKTLNYVFNDFEQYNQDGIVAMPSLEGPMMKSPVPVNTLVKAVYEALRIVAKDLKEQPDSEKDNLERLSVIGRVLPMFSLDDLRALWEDVKNEDYAMVSLFVDCLVQSGSNPAIMMVKELVETKQITEVKADGAVAAIGFYAKTPTRDLFYELFAFLKSTTLQNSKTVRQTAMLSIAELIHTACGSPFWTMKRWPTHIIGEFCTNKDAFITQEFIPFVVRELESYESGADRIVGLTILGTLGVEEILPYLRPYIVGAPSEFNDAAERISAIWSLRRVAFMVPEKVHPWLASIAGNVAERPDVRMAALGLLFTSNAPLNWWQKFAASTWFEPSHQVITYTNSLLHSFAKMPGTTHLNEEWAQKAKIVLPMVKPAPFGVPYSMDHIRSTHLKEDMTVLTRIMSFRISDEPLPVLFANRYFYQLGPFHPEIVSFYLWNYNMGGIWQNYFGKLYGKIFSEYEMNQSANEYSSVLHGIWDELKVTARPADKRAGLLHINLMGGIDRMLNLEKLEEMMPMFIADMMKFQIKPYEVSVSKYRMLAEYNIRMPTELGLPMRFLSTAPALFSLQGILKADGFTGFKSEITSEFSWKLATEIRVELPWSGNYIASGVDARVDIRLPKELGFKYLNGQVQVTWTPGNKVTDLIYYHVKPYTISRNWADSAVPTLEDPSVNLMYNHEPVERSLPVGERWGVNLRLYGSSEHEWTDLNTWMQWMRKWTVHGFSNLGFVPLKLNTRQYYLRYDPEDTEARSFQTWFKYETATKTCHHTKVYESGSPEPMSHEHTEITYSNHAEYQQIFSRIFKEIGSGSAQVYAGGFTVEQKDGTYIHFNVTFGSSNDAWWSKGFSDVQAERYTTNGPYGSKEVDWAVCWSSARNWNKPPTYGFSKDILYFTEDDTIYFGEYCDQNKIRFKAKIWRDEYAANVAITSPAGEQCQHDMRTGFMYGSPSCTQARRMDQTYNTYEMNFEAETLPEPVFKAVNLFRRWFTWTLYPYTVKHTTGDKNPANRATWIIKRDPYTGWSNMTILRPTETLVAHNVRVRQDYVPFSPVALAYARAFYPMRAASNWFREAASLTTGGVTEAQCFVGSDAVYTFDGASYNYTVNGCHHVLLTDCQKKTNFAVMSRKAAEGQQIVTVIYGKDTVELDPYGFITVNGDKVPLQDIPKEVRFEIRTPGMKHIKAVVYPTLNEGLIFEAKEFHFFVKVQESHVQLSAPYNLRGKTCGMCGDYNQEIHAEWKTADRCSLSSGELMAASYKLKTGEECTASDYDISMKLQKETESCQPIDHWFRTYLPEIDMKAPTKCTRYEKMRYQGTYVQGECETTEYRAYCQPGCKPFMMATRPFNFKCQGAIDDFVAPVTVPTTCVAA